MSIQAGMTALMRAARAGNLEMVQTLVTARAILDLKSKQVRVRVCQ